MKQKCKGGRRETEGGRSIVAVSNCEKMLFIKRKSQKTEIVRQIFAL